MYKVIYKTKNRATATAYFDDIRKAYNFAEAMYGIVLHSKGEKR